MRRRNTANGTIADAGFEMTDAQVADFDDFFADDLYDGTLAFTWAHPLTGTTYSWMFSEPPSKAKIGFDYNRVSCRLVRLP